MWTTWDGASRWEARIRYLLRAALRAEAEGDRRVAEVLRRMAAEARPADAGAEPVRAGMNA